MKAREVAHLLMQAPADADVFMEGCDCVGECSSVVLPNKNNPDDDGTVLLCRSDGYQYFMESAAKHRVTFSEPPPILPPNRWS